MKNNQKLIAKIYEEEKVFLTTGGQYYAYGRVGEKLQISKMNNLAMMSFLQKQRVEVEKTLIHWAPVVASQLQVNNLMGSKITNNHNQRSF